jgi:uncharacterized membrane protein YgcG
LPRPHRHASGCTPRRWHAFILNTRDYGQFCRCGFGRFLHHVPDCGAPRRPGDEVGVTVTHCAAHFSDASVDGGLDGLGSDGSGGGGDGGGDGGGGGCSSD